MLLECGYHTGNFLLPSILRYYRVEYLSNLGDVNQLCFELLYAQCSLIPRHWYLIISENFIPRSTGLIVLISDRLSLDLTPRLSRAVV